MLVRQPNRALAVGGSSNMVGPPLYGGPDARLGALQTGLFVNTGSY